MTFMDETVSEVNVRIISDLFAFIFASSSVLVMILNGDVVSGAALILLSSQLILTGMTYITLVLR
jgi:hypothetical protein